MAKISLLFIITGAVAIIYGALILWNVSSSRKEVAREDWLNSAEIRSSKLNSIGNMRYLLRPERQNISFSHSRGRGYAMLAIGIALIVMAFT